MSAPATRRVRVTVEADARPLIHQPELLRVACAAGVWVVDTTSPDVTVEDVEQPRTWTDGDVVVDDGPGGSGRVWTREGGEWHTPNFHDATANDDAASGDVASGVSTVLRYQAGE